MTTESTTPATPPARASKPEVLEGITGTLEKLTALYLDMLEQIRSSSASHTQHADKMLTWAIGLMGGGLFYVNSLLQSTIDRGLRFAALAPWIVGILAALAARVIGLRQRESSAAWYPGEVFNIKGQLLLSTSLAETLGVFIGAVVRLRSEFRAAMHSGLFCWFLRLSVAAHVMAGTGVLTVVTVSFLEGASAYVTVAGVCVVAVIIFRRIFSGIKKTYDDGMQKAEASFAAMRKRFDETSPMGNVREEN